MLKEQLALNEKIGRIRNVPNNEHKAKVGKNQNETEKLNENYNRFIFWRYLWCNYFFYGKRFSLCDFRDFTSQE